MTFFSFQWPVWLQSTKRYWMVRLMHTTCISAPAGNISIMRTAFFFFFCFLMYWKKLWNSICDMDSNISTLLIGFSLLHTKTKTNQTHNVKDLMVVEFFSNNVYKVQLTLYSLYWRNMVYYYKISQISITFLIKHFALFLFFCIFEIPYARHYNRSWLETALEY